MRGKHRRYKNRHHPIPISRLNGGKLIETVLIDMELHRRFHSLFGNRTPQEILEFLNNYFWGGQFKLSIE
jgi:hypothetical protein